MTWQSDEAAVIEVLSDLLALNPEVEAEEADLLTLNPEDKAEAEAEDEKAVSVSGSSTFK